MDKILIAFFPVSLCIASATSQEIQSNQEPESNITKIWIDGSDVVFSSSQGKEKKIAYETIAAELATLKDIEEIWFHGSIDDRQAIELVEPAVYKFARRRNIPMSLYFDREFTKLAYKVFNLPVTVEGDAELLTRIRDANKKYHEELERGEFFGVVTRDGDTASMRFKWSGENTRIEFDSDSLSTRGGRPESGLGVRTAKDFFVYFESINSVIHYNNPERRLYGPMNCHPRECWYTYRGSLPWFEMLDHENPRGDISSFKIVEAEDGNVIVERGHPNGVVYFFTIAPQLGFRITKFRTNQKEERKGDLNYDIQWAKTPDGDFYPKQLTVTQQNVEAKWMQIDILHYKSGPIDPSEFKFRRASFPPEASFKFFDKEGKEIEPVD